MTLTAKNKKRILLIGIVLVNIGGLSVINSLDISLILELYGLLALCQVSFLLFFLSRISLRSLLRS
jgi:hypothetical protein